MNHSVRLSFLVCMAAPVAAGGCMDSIAYVSEARAIVLAREALAERGVQATDATHALTGITACDGRTPETCETVGFTLDGWDPARHVGFEYVADNDPDFGKGTRWSDIVPAEHLQTAVDAALAGTGDTVIIIRQWAHETDSLAEEQFVRKLEGRLVALGL